MNDKRARWLALYVLCLGDLMIVLDTNIVNVALPSIQADLGFSQAALAWVVERLHAHLRRLPAAVGPAGRPVRQQAGVPRRRGRLHPQLRGLRPGAQRGPAGRRPRGPGPRRGRGVGGGPGADHGPVHRARRAGEGDGLLRLRHVRRRRGRRAPGRGADRAVQLALDLPGERADRRRRPADRPSGAARGRGRGRAWPPRRARRRAGDAGADDRGVRRGRRQRGRLDHPADAGPARGRDGPHGRVRGARGDRRAPAGAAAAVHAAQRGRQPGRRGAVGRRDVRLLLPLRALPPAGAGVRRPRGRAWRTCRPAWSWPPARSA